MTRTHLIAASTLCIALNLFHFFSYSQTSEDLMGRWEGVHYYGDTTRLFDGTLVVRATTIDSMRMVLTIDKMKEGKFEGKLLEHLYSDSIGSYFKADVSGFVKNDELHFVSFRIRENKLPKHYRWCPPKATGLMVKKKDIYFLHMSFESTLTCTVGPAIVERKIAQNVAKTPVDSLQNVTGMALPAAFANKPELSVIAEKFGERKRSVISTISVQSDSIKINFLDNSVVDGDSISVFINGQIEASHVRLTAKAFSMNVKFEDGVNEIEVAMFAENLGSLPPNTALMQIIDGDKIHRAHLSSDTKSSAVIKIIRGK
jgi:hypothetical protein